jgi:hypothetical protein
MVCVGLSPTDLTADAKLPTRQPPMGWLLTGIASFAKLARVEMAGSGWQRVR